MIVARFAPLESRCAATRNPLCYNVIRCAKVVVLHGDPCTLLGGGKSISTGVAATCADVHDGDPPPPGVVVYQQHSSIVVHVNHVGTQHISPRTRVVDDD